MSKVPLSRCRKHGHGSMNIYVTTSFNGYYPVGTAAVVVAENPTQALQLLTDRLNEMKLEQSEDDIEAIEKDFSKPIDLSAPQVTILNDGNY